MFQDAHLDDITMKKSKEERSSNLRAIGRTVTLGWGGPMVERDRLGLRCGEQGPLWFVIIY